MKKWVLKAIIQKVLTYLPFSFKINYWFQKHITKAVVLNELFFEDLLRHYKVMSDQFAIFSRTDFENKRILELGTGWHPIVPVCHFLCGADEITSVDLRDLIRKENLQTLMRWIIDYRDSGKLEKYLPHLKESRLKELNEILKASDKLNKVEILEKLKIRHLIGDITSMPMRSDYFDMSCSVNVLEHVHLNILDRIIASFYGSARTGSVHYHSFGCYDHFQHVDKSISKFNYLKYSEKQWKIIDNDIQPQNRLRVNRFGELFQANKFTILAELHSEPNFDEFDKLKIHSDFANIDRSIAAIDYGTFVVGK